MQVFQNRNNAIIVLGFNKSKSLFTSKLLYYGYFPNASTKIRISNSFVLLREVFLYVNIYIK